LRPPALGRSQQHPHGDIKMNEVVFQESGGMLDAELLLKQDSHLHNVSAQKIASHKACGRNGWRPGRNVFLDAHFGIVLLQPPALFGLAHPVTKFAFGIVSFIGAIALTNCYMR